MGKAFKYTFWAFCVLLGYHLYLVRKTDKPEEGFAVSEWFLRKAENIDASFADFFLMMTRPPVEKLLPDRMPIPRGQPYPKTLVLNMKGTLVHSEYKFGTGFEI